MPASWLTIPARTPQSRPFTSTELAWAAGLFEGEGSIRVNTPTRRNRGTLMVSISNTDVEILVFFAERWGGYFKAVSKKLPEHAQGYAWMVAAGVAATFLADILPYLRTNRYRRRARLGLRFQRQKSKNTTVNRSPAYIARQEWYFHTFQRLNTRGAARDERTASCARRSR